MVAVVARWTEAAARWKTVSARESSAVVAVAADEVFSLWCMNWTHFDFKFPKMEGQFRE